MRLRTAPQLRHFSERELAREIRYGRAYLNDENVIVPFISGATQVSNTFDGGTDGAGATGDITTGNSGGVNGTAFNQVLKDTTGTPGTVAYSSAQVKRGALSMQVASGSVSSAACVVWSTARGSFTDDYMRAYFYATAWPSIVGRQVQWFISTLTSIGAIRWTNTGTWAILNPSNTVVATSTTVIPTGQWCRIEAFKHYDTAAGYITCRIFKGANVDGSTPDEEFGGSGFTWADTAGTADRIYIGMPGAGGANQPAGGSFFVDDIASGAATWIGPSVLNQSLRPDADNAAGGWTTTPLWSKVDEATPGGDVITATAS